MPKLPGKKKLKFDEDKMAKFKTSFSFSARIAALKRKLLPGKKKK